MTNDLQEEYLTWLEPQTGVQEQEKTYRDLLRLMLQKEFVPWVPFDDNRVADGLDVRKEFLREVGAENTLGPCSVLEVLVAISRKLEFAAGGVAPGWAWQLIRNLELHRMYDPLPKRKQTATDIVLEALIWRTYAKDGYGGFFPLAWPNPELDYRQIELWYQMAAYIEEIHDEY